MLNVVSNINGSAKNIKMEVSWSKADGKVAEKVFGKCICCSVYFSRLCHGWLPVTVYFSCCPVSAQATVNQTLTCIQRRRNTSAMFLIRKKERKKGTAIDPGCNNKLNKYDFSHTFYYILNILLFKPGGNDFFFFFFKNVCLQ